MTAMIEATQRKLREADFFYRRMLDASKIRDPKDETFGYYFSAFIGAARSVTWTMRAEEEDRYDAWKPTWESSRTKEEIELETKTNEWRLDLVHRRGVDVTTEWDWVVPDWHDDERIRKALRKSIQALSTKFPMMALDPTHPVGPIKTFEPARFVQHENGRDEAAAICKIYLEYMKKKVSAFLAAHAE